MPSNPAIAAGAIVAGIAALSRKATVDNSKVQLIHAPQTANIEGGKALLDILDAECPSLTDPDTARFVPSALLPTADLQTCFNSIKDRLGRQRIVDYERELITTEDGGTIGVDWSPPFAQMPEDDRPIVVLSHGLTGGSQETYVQVTVKHLTAAPYNFRTVVVNCRGCAGVKLTTPVLYNGGLTSDYGFAVDHIRSRFPQSKLIAVGFSLGANMITKYVGEQGDACPLKAAISVCNPYDMSASSDALDEPKFRNRYIYNPALVDGLVRLFRRHKKMIETGSVVLDMEAAAKVKTVRQFDDIMTSQMFGFKDAADYYSKSSCAQFMPNIKVPFLAITALDDPVCHERVVPRDIFRANPHLVLALTQYGGHLGFHEKPGVSWFPRPIAEFCSAIFNNTSA